MRLGDLDALKTILFNDTQYGFWHDSMDGSDVAYTQRDLFKCIDAMPTIDAVPVVRCKDCKWFDEVVGKDSGKPCGYGACRRPLSMKSIIVADDFCSYGERRDGEG